jgi:hypothetical protein
MLARASVAFFVCLLVGTLRGLLYAKCRPVSGCLASVSVLLKHTSARLFPHWPTGPACAIGELCSLTSVPEIMLLEGRSDCDCGHG